MAKRTQHRTSKKRQLPLPILASTRFHNEMFPSLAAMFIHFYSIKIQMVLLFIFGHNACKWVGRMVTFWELPPFPPKNCSLLWSSTTFHIIYYWLFRLTCSCFQSLFWSRVTTFWYPLGGLPHCSRRSSSKHIFGVTAIFPISLPLQLRLIMATWLGLEDTVWKFHYFSVIQILREINFHDDGLITIIFAVLEALNFV